MQSFAMRLCALFLIVFVAGCNSSNDSSSAAPSFEEMAGGYLQPAEAEPESVQASAEGDIGPEGVVSAIVSESGYVRLSVLLPREEDPGNTFPGPTPPYVLTVFGYADISEDAEIGAIHLVGRLNQAAPWPVYASPALPPGPPFAELDLYVYPDLTLSGMLTMHDGTELAVDLEWSEALSKQAGLQAMQGFWGSFPFSWWEEDPDHVTLEFDDMGLGFGSLNDECAVDVTLQPLIKSEILTLDANTSEQIPAGDVFFMQADVSVTGCQDATEYVGDLTLRKWNPEYSYPIPRPSPGGKTADFLLGDENGTVFWEMIPVQLQ